jgi:hypothetical protein
MKLERSVPCETPARLQSASGGLGFVPPLMLAVALAVMSVISGLH